MTDSMEYRGVRISKHEVREDPDRPPPGIWWFVLDAEGRRTRNWYTSLYELQTAVDRGRHGKESQ